MEVQDIELKINDPKHGAFAISLVESPAIEDDFVFLNTHEIQLKVVDEDQRILVGFALIPDMKIPRLMKGKRFNIFFSKDTVAQTAELYMKNMNLDKFTVDHQRPTSDVYVFESWIVEDPKNDKSNLYGLKPKGGEWVIKTRVDNDQVWNKVKLGEYKGFSIEALYGGLEQFLNNQIIDQLKKIITENTTV